MSLDLNRNRTQTKTYSDLMQEEADRAALRSEQLKKLKELEGPTKEEEREHQKELIKMYGFLNKAKIVNLAKFEELRQKAADKLGIDAQDTTVDEEVSIKLEIGRSLGFKV